MCVCPHIWSQISRKRRQIAGWFQWTAYRNLPMGYRLRISQLSAGYCHFGWLVGWWLVVSVTCLFVRAINRSTSGFPNALFFCCCRKPARWENQTSLPLLASYKGCLLYVDSVPSWKLGPARMRPQVSERTTSPTGLSVCLSVRPSVCDAGGLWSNRLEILKLIAQPNTFAPCGQKAIHLLPREHWEIWGD